MCSFTVSPVLTAQEPTKVSFGMTTLIKCMLSLVNLSSTLSLLKPFLGAPYGALPRPSRKTGYILVILCSLLALALAATDCEILNSGISSISSTTCCTETSGIVCVNGRVTVMYAVTVFNSISDIDYVVGKLPLEIGQITELIELNIYSSDLSAGPVPDSIDFCTKLVKLRFYSCKLQGAFPKGLRTLKSLRMSICC
jgi:hypothetical protein